jgi:hypothetical protein
MNVQEMIKIINGTLLSNHLGTYQVAGQFWELGH